jgi:hypothetical protein
MAVWRQCDCIKLQSGTSSAPSVFIEKQVPVTLAILISLVFLTLYVDNVSLKSNSDTQFSPWGSMMNLYTDGPCWNSNLVRELLYYLQFCIC